MGCCEATRDDCQARSIGLEVKKPKGFARVRMQMRHVPAACGARQMRHVPAACGARLQPFAVDAGARGAAVRPVLPSPRPPARRASPRSLQTPHPGHASGLRDPWPTARRARARPRRPQGLPQPRGG